MDPDANIAEQLRLVARINRARDSRGVVNPSDVLRLAELVEALDEWIRHGGFLPRVWDRRRTVDRDEVA